jgi:SAM-dependent methyltransferase
MDGWSRRCRIIRHSSSTLALWLVSRGLDVVAVEPSAALLAEARRLHPSPSIRWLSDTLPGLDKVFRLALSFDLMLLSAVWAHVRPGDRSRAFRKLITLLKPGGCIAITLRHGPVESERGMHDVSQAEIELLARAHGAFVEIAVDDKDEFARSSVTWTQLIAVPQPSGDAGRPAGVRDCAWL